MDKPTCFIASSREGLRIAQDMKQDLDNDAWVTLWTHDVFKPSSFPLEALERKLDTTDFAAFVFSPDDLVLMRGQAKPAARDNVVFELGLFIGALGRERCFVIKPKGEDAPRLPTDLLGLEPLEFHPNFPDGNILAALGTPCHRIRKEMERLGIRRPRPSPSSTGASAAPEEVKEEPVFLVDEIVVDQWKRALRFEGEPGADKFEAHGRIDEPVLDAEGKSKVDWDATFQHAEKLLEAIGRPALPVRGRAHLDLYTKDPKSGRTSGKLSVYFDFNQKPARARLVRGTSISPDVADRILREVAARLSHVRGVRPSN